MAILSFLTHSPVCNRKQDWSEAEDALSYAPEGPDRDSAYSELQQAKKTCTCGVQQALESYTRSWYLAGLRDAGLPVGPADEEHFNKTHLINVPRIP